MPERQHPSQSDAQIVHIHARDPRRGEFVARPARCTRRYVARVGYIGGCGWEGHLVRTIGADDIPPCPICGSWTEPIVATRQTMRRFREDGWPR